MYRWWRIEKRGWDGETLSLTLTIEGEPRGREKTKGRNRDKGEGEFGGQGGRERGIQIWTFGGGTTLASVPIKGHGIYREWQCFCRCRCMVLASIEVDGAGINRGRWCQRWCRSRAMVLTLHWLRVIMSMLMTLMSIEGHSAGVD